MADSAGAVTVKLLSEGTDLGNPGIMSVIVTHRVNAISNAEIIIDDGSVSTREFKVSNDPKYAPGSKISIEAGPGTTTTPIFHGIVVRQAIRCTQEGRSAVTLELKHAAVKMSHGRKAKNFLEKKDSEILEEMIGDHGLSAEVDATDTAHEKMVQYQVSDWDFMLMRADASGLLVYTQDEDKVLAKLPVIEEGSDTPELAYGINIFEFEAEMEARDQFGEVTAIAWDHSTQELLDTTGEDPSVTEAGTPEGATLATTFGEGAQRLRHVGELVDTELIAWGSAVLQRSRMSKVRGRIKVKGSADYVVGGSVKIDGMSDLYNGAAFVSGVRHDLSRGQWISEIQIGIDPKTHVERFPDVAEPAASGLLAPIRGLQIGVVKEIKDDPKSFFRVLVKIPVVDDQEDGVWCRMAHPDAGASHTLFFQPQIGDEVVVGFLNEDPRFPIILGSLHNSDANAPAIEDNDEFKKAGVVTVEGLKLIFNDEDKSVTIETPAGKKITADEKEKYILLEDENGNKVQIDQDGILLESAADIILKATGDVTIEGVNITASASAQFKAEGSGGVEVSSSAVAVLKGSMVQIN